MKLSAPPPPPPDPNDPGQPTPADGETTPDAPEATPAAPAEKALAWPAWFAGADFALAVLALILVFLLASFAARNSDLWPHLAAGKRLLAGEYTPGTDPFSYTAADRTWVNHSLLYDVGVYLLYKSAGGAGLVAAKALAAALAFGLLIGIRRPGFPLWPWAAVAAVAAVAAAPYLLLRPVVGSVLLLAVTLFLLFRVPHRPGSWRFPAAVGVTFWVWAMTDEWFFLGPLALALVLAGELIQGRRADAADVGPDPLGPLPDVPTLARALGVGVLACMLNPHHVRVWELPFELVGAKELAADARFRQLLLGPFSASYVDAPGLGYNQNGLAFFVLFVGGGAAVGLGPRVRLADVALWVGFALLGLVTVSAIPFLAVVAVPLVAGRLNAMSAGLALKTWGDPKTRLLLLGSGGGRVVVLLAVLGGCVLAWPGWVHPPATNPAYARRVAWAVEPEPGMARAAGQLQAWREGGRLPAEVRGLVASLELANYCAWFAPLEKVYANARYNHHRPEFPDLVAARVGLGLVRGDQPPDPKALPEVLRRAGAEYVAVHAGPGESQQARGWAAEATLRQWVDPDHWSPWYFDGRSAVSGWRESAGGGGPAFDALRVDPVVLAFGPGVEPLPAGRATPPPARGGWEMAFVRGADPAPPGADEAFAWVQYAGVRQALLRARRQAVNLTFHLADRVAGGGRGASVLTPLLLPDDDQGAVPFLALRAARRAIAAAPDHPDGYAALADTLLDRTLPLSESERVAGRVAALRQCLDRMPPPEDYRPGAYHASPARVAYFLAVSYRGRTELPGSPAVGLPASLRGFDVLHDAGATRVVVADKGGPALRYTNEVPQQFWRGGPYLQPLDLAREVLKTAQAYAAVEQNETPEDKAFRATLADELKAVESELGRMNNAFEAALGRSPKPADRVRLALRLNLAGEALKVLTDRDLDPSRDLGPDAPGLLLCRVALELAVGRVADAAADLDGLAADPGFQPKLAEANFLRAFRGLMYQRFLVEGNYAEAGRVLEYLDGDALREDPNKAARDQFDPKPFVEAKPGRPAWAYLAPLVARLAPLPVDVAGGPAAVVTELLNVSRFQSLQADLALRRNAQANFFYARGVLHLLEGNVPEAEKRFLQTRLPAVPEWGLPALTAREAELYLRLIGEARRRAGGG